MERADRKEVALQGRGLGQLGMVEREGADDDVSENEGYRAQLETMSETYVSLRQHCEKAMLRRVMEMERRRAQSSHL